MCRPPVAVLQPPDNAELRPFHPIDARLPAEGGDPTVAGEGPEIAGFLMGPQAGNAVAHMQAAEQSHHIAAAHHQRLAEPPEVRPQIFKALPDERPLPPDVSGSPQ